MTKVCSKCREPKPLTDFTKNKATKDGLNHSCRGCHRRYVKNHYEANKPYYKAKAKQRRVAVLPEIRQIIRDAKDRPCVDCNVRYPYYVMDFDHVRGRKKGHVGKMVSCGSVKTLLKEIAKCEVVCANCHRERTFGSNSPRSSIG